MLACYTQNSVKNDQHENWQVFLSLEKPFMREAKLVIAKFVLLIQAEKKTAQATAMRGESRQSISKSNPYSNQNYSLRGSAFRFLRANPLNSVIPRLLNRAQGCFLANRVKISHPAKKFSALPSAIKSRNEIGSFSRTNGSGSASLGYSPDELS